MKKFNKEIQITVQVDTIAEQLRDLMPDAKHGDQIVETIIDLAINHNDCTYLYNSLNGYSNELNFDIGDIVDCTSSEYFRKEGDDDSHRNVLGIVKIVEIDIYAIHKLKVEYNKLDSSGKITTGKTDVLHTNCQLIPKEKVTESIQRVGRARRSSKIQDVVITDLIKNEKKDIVDNFNKKQSKSLKSSLKHGQRW